MQFDTSNPFITDALAVVRRYDPALYQRMSADDWRITTNGADYLACLERVGIDSTRDGLAMSSTWGMTLSEPMRVTWLNESDISTAAPIMGIHTADFAADVLAHEYRHIHQPWHASNAEPPAFRAGSAFAAKLPYPDGPRLKAMSDETYRELYT